MSHELNVFCLYAYQRRFGGTSNTMYVVLTRPELSRETNEYFKSI